MNLFLKLIFVCIAGVVLCLLVKKNSPEIALAISICIVLVCLTVIIRIAKALDSQFHTIEAFTYLSIEAFVPIIKCIAISVITQISCAICKDAGQTAVAYGLDFTGTIVLVLCMMPLINKLFQLVGGIL